MTQDDIQNKLAGSARDGDIEEVLAAITAGADIDSTSEQTHGNTALHVAASRRGSTEMIRLLLDRGASVNAVNRFGDTPLHLAVSRGNSEAVRLLVGKGADINAGDRLQNTPLHLASRGGFCGIVRLLLQHGAGIGLLNVDGQTALDLVAAPDDVVRVLAEALGRSDRHAPVIEQRRDVAKDHNRGR